MVKNSERMHFAILFYMHAIDVSKIEENCC